MDVAIVGGGPAGLRAAESAAEAGASVTIFDAKPSVGRKFLIAGRGGLNLTKAEPLETFSTRYAGPQQPDGIWKSLLQEFGPEAIREWAASLGVETFVASTGRIYPRELKSAPLLRRWLHRLRAAGVRFQMRHCWSGLVLAEAGIELLFEVDGCEKSHTARSVVLAMGGGSWPQTGSDGAWVARLRKLGVGVVSLEPANCGWELYWPASLADRCEGKPLKNIAVTAGETTVAGELLITRYGLEGGAIYQLGPVLRSQSEPAISIDLKPSFTVERLAEKLSPLAGNLLAQARPRWRLSESAFTLLSFFATEEARSSPDALARLCKHCLLRLSGPRPLAEAISSAGGIQWSELNGDLMLRALPGVFAAGEMIDWEAPTGGYLLQGCFATGARAGVAAAHWRRIHA